MQLKKPVTDGDRKPKPGEWWIAEACMPFCSPEIVKVSQLAYTIFSDRRPTLVVSRAGSELESSLAHWRFIHRIDMSTEKGDDQ